MLVMVLFLYERGYKMQTYSEFRPTGFDSAGAFLDDRQDWLVAPVSRTRDSGPFDESNFAAALEMLGGESEEVEVHRFGHWGPGWFEIIIVAPNTDAAKKAEDIEASLENYPLLDDEDFSRREYDDFLESWDNWAARQFRKFLLGQHVCGFCGGKGYRKIRPWGEVPCPMCEAAENIIDDIDDGKLREFYMNHASEPYYSESSGVAVTFREREFSGFRLSELV